MNALDIENNTSCWNSEGQEGSAQWFVVDFRRSVRVDTVRLQFQAGFIGETCAVEAKIEKDGGGGGGGGAHHWEQIDEFEFDDVHEVQSSPLEESTRCTALKLIFDDFTDFYGRVTVYRAEVWGKEIDRLSSDSS